MGAFGLDRGDGPGVSGMEASGLGGVRAGGGVRPGGVSGLGGRPGWGAFMLGVCGLGGLGWGAFGLGG